MASGDLTEDISSANVVFNANVEIIKESMLIEDIQGLSPGPQLLAVCKMRDTQ